MSLILFVLKLSKNNLLNFYFVSSLYIIFIKFYKNNISNFYS